MKNRDIKEVFLLICHREGLKQQDIINIYNQKAEKELSKQNSSQMINKNTIKYSVLFDVLDSIGYEIEIKKRL